MYTLQEIGYLNSEKLRPKYHWHKSAVTPFVAILTQFFSGILKTNGIKPIYEIATENEMEFLSIGIPVIIASKQLIAHPVPPLNIIVTSDDGRQLSYQKELEKYLNEQGASSMEALAKKLANMRNKILYASHDGYPKIKDLQDQFFVLRKRRVIMMLIAYLLIQPYSERQPFVQHCLDKFLVILGAMTNPFADEEV